jgi:hypothetical protein
MADVTAIVHPFKADLTYCLVGASKRFCQRSRNCGSAQDPASGGDQLAAAKAGAGVKDLDAGNAFGNAESGDGEADLVSTWISARACNDACGGALRPSKLRRIKPAVNTCFQRIDKVGVQPKQDGLGFRIAKPSVELKYMGPAGGHHQPAVKNSNERRSFFRHGLDGGLGNVAQDPFGHAGFEQRVGRVDSHAAGVGTDIAFADALVILGRGERGTGS